MRFGAIDIGTNSFHLIVVELDAQFGSSRTVLKAREMVRLGADAALQRGELSDAAIERGVEVLKQFADAACEAGATSIHTVATSAVREVRNREAFITRVQQATGLRVEVLSETEEARLIHLGVVHGFPLHDRLACILDIGGGSSELIVADTQRTYLLTSVKLGSLRLYDEYLRDDHDAGTYRNLVRHIRTLLEPVAEHARAFAPQIVVGTSGTIMGLALLDAAQSGIQLRRTHGYELRLERMRQLQREMLRMDPAQRRRMPGMNPRRSDIIIAGNAIAIEALELLGVEQLVVCDRALREGVIVDYLVRNAALTRVLDARQHQRAASVRALAQRFGTDGDHEEHVARLATELFDQLEGLHALERGDRELLRSAALLHDIGHAVGRSGHHKHGAYLIKHTVLAGWSAREQELLAALVRYHRKALPKPSHPEWAALTASERGRVEKLAALLRLADGLDARHMGFVAGIDLKRLGTDIKVEAKSDQDIAVELAAAHLKSDLFTRVFGCEPTFRTVSDERAVV